MKYKSIVLTHKRVAPVLHPRPSDYITVNARFEKEFTLKEIKLPIKAKEGDRKGQLVCIGSSTDGLSGKSESVWVNKTKYKKYLKYHVSE